MRASVNDLLEERIVMADNLSFEQASQKLDEIVEKINSGTTSLEEMVGLYEEGINLVNYCNDLLNSYRSRIDKIAVKNDAKV